MKILIACEYSGVVRDAFIKKGHDAISCDILESESPGLHYKGDVLDILYDGFDMMIGHPPCTYLSNVSAIHYDVKKWGQKAIDRMAKRQLAIEFFKILQKAPIGKICLENPLPGKELTNEVGFYHQLIHHKYFFFFSLMLLLMLLLASLGFLLLSLLIW